MQLPAITTLVERIASGLALPPGEHFFPQLVESLARSLNVYCAQVGSLDTGAPRRIQTVAVFRNGQIVPNFTYELANTPCAEVVSRSACIYPCDVRRLFPADELLPQIQAESYAGIPLRDSQGEAIGLLVAVDRRPMEQGRLVEAVLQIYAVRAAAELERLKSRQALAASEERFRTFMEQTPALAFLKGHDGRFLWVNSAWGARLGLSSDQIIGHTDADLWNEDIVQRHQEIDRLVLETGQRVEVPEYTTDPDGQQHIWTVLKFRVPQVMGPPCIGGLAFEVTEQKRSEEQTQLRAQQLRQHNAALRALSQSDALVRGDIHAAVREIVRTSAETLHVDRVSIWLFNDVRTKISCRTMYDRGHEKDATDNELETDCQAEFLQALERYRTLTVSDATTDPRAASFLACCQDPDTIRALLDAPVRVRGQVVGLICHEQLRQPRRWTEEEEVFVGSLADFVAMAIETDEHQRAEEELRRREAMLAHVSRLSTMGELVAGIAHEINQPLYAILNFAAACSNALAHGDPSSHGQLLEWVDGIRESASRAGTILQRLRRFASRKEPESQSMSIGDLIQESIDLLAFEIRRRTVRVDVQPSDPRLVVSVDRVQMQQVLVNLLKNALEAQADTEVSSRRVLISAALSPEGVHVSLEDRGVGLPDMDIPKLFDPFVTTKVDGMGLGLAISKTIVEKYGGRLWATMNAGRGATFHFTIPYFAEQRDDIGLDGLRCR